MNMVPNKNSKIAQMKAIPNKFAIKKYSSSSIGALSVPQLAAQSMQLQAGRLS